MTAIRLRIEHVICLLLKRCVYCKRCGRHWTILGYYKPCKSCGKLWQRLEDQLMDKAPWIWQKPTAP